MDMLRVLEGVALIAQKSHVNLLSWKMNWIQLFLFLFLDPLVRKRNSLKITYLTVFLLVEWFSYI